MCIPFDVLTSLNTEIYDLWVNYVVRDYLKFEYKKRITNCECVKHGLLLLFSIYGKNIIWLLWGNLIPQYRFISITRLKIFNKYDFVLLKNKAKTIKKKSISYLQ